MKRKSARIKGKVLQNKVRDIILNKFKSLEPSDIVSCPSGVSGEDIILSTRARELFPYSVECKNQESFSVWSALKQAEGNANGKTPIVVFKRNRSKTYVVLEFDKFMDLL